MLEQPNIRPVSPEAASKNAPDKTNGLSVLQPDNTVYALGLAVNYLMTKSPFNMMRFGAWSRILTGQINRKHYFFAVKNGRIVGFLGWASTSHEQAESWVEGHRDDFDVQPDGDTLIVNVWEAADKRVNRYLLSEFRKVMVGKQRIYARRFYRDGRMRPLRLSVNAFVKDHVDKQN